MGVLQFDPRARAYAEYRDRVAAYVHGKVGYVHEAEDLVSTVFEKMQRNWDSFDPARASLSTWIYTIAHNVVVDYYRSRHDVVEFVDAATIDVEDVVDEGEDVQERLERLAAALQKLKERDRDLIVLHYYQGRTLKDIAQAMGMSYINAKVVHKKALEALRAHMGA